VLLDGEDVTSAIRAPAVTAASGAVASNPVVRRRLVEWQRALAADRNIVCEGRDQGTIVFPHAERKFFLFADPLERARRRHKDLVARGDQVSVEEVLAAQEARDRRDAARAIAPMVPAPDAIHLDTTHLPLEQVVDRLEAEVRRFDRSLPSARFGMTPAVVLRDVAGGDLPVFFQQQLDPVANQRAAFTAKDPSDRDAFAAKWTKILCDDTITKKTILFEGHVAGSVVSFVAPWSGKPEVTYWLGREYWGQGIATRALAEFLKQVKTRPLYARAARDNVASIRVLEKCGFMISGHDRAFANGRGEEIEEFILELPPRVGE